MPKLLNNPLSSCSSINFDFIISHTAHIDKSIILPFFDLGTSGFLLSVFFLQFKQYDKIVYCFVNGLNLINSLNF